MKPLIVHSAEPRESVKRYAEQYADTYPFSEAMALDLELLIAGELAEASATMIPSGWRATELRSECGRYVISSLGGNCWDAGVLPSHERISEFTACLTMLDAVDVCDQHARSTAVDVGSYDANGSPVDG